MRFSLNRGFRTPSGSPFPGYHTPSGATCASAVPNALKSSTGSISPTAQRERSAISRSVPSISRYKTEKMFEPIRICRQSVGCFGITAPRGFILCIQLHRDDVHKRNWSCFAHPEVHCDDCELHEPQQEVSPPWPRVAFTKAVSQEENVAEQRKGETPTRLLGTL